MKKAIFTKRRVPFIEQAQQTECGLCCMAMISSYYKKQVSFYDLHEIVGSGRDGITLHALQNLAIHLDFEANWYKLKHNELSSIKLPAIIYWNNSHFVVLERIQSNDFVILDPAIGRRKIPIAGFSESYSGYILSCEPNEIFTQQKQPNVWKPFVEILFSSKKLFYFIIGITLFLQLFTVGMPLMIQYFIDNIIIPNNKEMLNLFLALIILIVLFQTAFSFMRGKLLITLNNYLDTKLMTKFFKHLLRLPYQFFQLRSFGDLLFRVNSLRNIRDILSSQVIKGLLDTTFLVTMLIYMSTQSLIITSLVVIIFTLDLLLYATTKNRIKEVNVEEIIKNTEMYSIQTEVVYSIFNIKTAGTEENIYQRWFNSFKELLVAYKRKATLFNYIDTGRSLLNTIAPLLVLWIGAKLASNDIISLGAVIALYALSQQFFALSNSVLAIINSFLLTSAYLRRVQDVWDAPPESSGANLVKVKELKGEIELKNVSFSYTKYSPQVVKNISFKVSPGKKVALVGMSGSGKSTLSRILLGLYTPTVGNIYYDGKNINDLDKSSLRRKMGVVPQDVSLFNKTILENITMGNKDITMEEVIEACQVAQIHDEIQMMPMKYNTIVSEMGFGISGGQRQRIALARAVVNKPSILILDEATSSLDHINEQRIDEYLSNMKCTRVVIAHRLTTIMNSDLILVMENGEIIEQGNHEDLVSLNGYYSQFFNKYRKNPSQPESTLSY